MSTSSYERLLLEDSPARGSSFFHAYSLTERDLDRAIATGRHDLARLISDLYVAEEEVHGPSMRLVRAHMKQRAIPLYEGLSTLLKGQPLDTPLADEVTSLYNDTGESLQRLFYYKELFNRERDPTLRRELTGGISEFVIFALYNRAGLESPFIAVPTAAQDDGAGYNKIGEKIGVDFFAYQREALLAPPARVQVKTSNHLKDAYDPTILMVHLEELAGTHHKATTALPKAIIADALDVPTLTQERLIQRAQRLLARKTFDHLQKFETKNRNI